MIDGATAVDNKPSATVNSESYLEWSRDTRKTKMAIMETNICPEPICHGHEIVNKISAYSNIMTCHQIPSAYDLIIKAEISSV